MCHIRVSRLSPSSHGNAFLSGEGSSRAAYRPQQAERTAKVMHRKIRQLSRSCVIFAIQRDNKSSY